MEVELRNILMQLVEGQTRLETEVKKNSIKLEAIEKKVDIIAEVQTAHKEQNTREINQANKLTIEKTDLLETVLINTSKDIKEVKESIEVLKDMTGRHEVDINILKRRPV